MLRFFEESIVRCGVESTYNINNWKIDNGLLPPKAANDSKEESEFVPNKDIVIPEYFEQFLNGKFDELITNFLSRSANFKEKCPDFVLKMYKKSIFRLIIPLVEDFSDNDNLFYLQIIGISCLNIFIRENWFGPQAMISMDTEDFQSCFDRLTVNGEIPIEQIRRPDLLLAAEFILVDTVKETKLNSIPTTAWWGSRCLFVHQRLLTQTTMDLKVKMCRLMDLAVDDYGISLKNKEFEKETHLQRFRRELSAQAYIELAIVHQFHEDHAKARDAIKKASNLLNLDVCLSGGMGFRLKFQTKPTSQLYLSVRHSINPRKGSATEGRAAAGKLLEEEPLEPDSELREHIEFQDAIDSCLLCSLSQSLVHLLCVDHKSKCAEDELRTEELLAYVTRILRDPTDYVIHLHSLILKSKLEVTPKTIERSARQFESIVKSYLSPCSELETASKLSSFWQVPLDSIWSVKKELGLRWYALGCTEQALKLFEELFMWDQIVICYLKMNDKAKAEEVCKEQLRIKKTPAMLCLLGDVTNNVDYYNEAWDFSNHSFARAMRSIGEYYFGKGEYRKSIDSFTTALAINPIAVKSWYINGCAALHLKDWSTAASSFSRVVSLDSEDGEAWSNLAASYLEMGKQGEAYHALQEAAKAMPRNCKVLQNLALIGTRLGDLQGAIFALRRLVDLKQPLDMQIYGVIASIITKSIKSDQIKPAIRAYSELYEYVAKEVSSPGSDFWEIGYFFYEAIGKMNDSYKYCSKLCIALDGSWDKDEKPDRWNAVGEAYLRLASTCLKSAPAAGLKGDELTEATNEYKSRISATITKLKTLSSKAKPKFSSTETYANVIAAISTLEKHIQ